MSEEVFYKKQFDGTFVPAGGVYTDEEKRLRKLRSDIEWAKSGYHWQLYMGMVSRNHPTIGGEAYREYFKELAKLSLLATEVYFEEKGIL